MKLTSVFIKFTGLYFLTRIIAFVISAMLTIKYNSGVSFAVLIYATSMSCDSFTKKNGVFFTNSEFRKVVFGFALINMMFTAAGTALFLIGTSIPMTSTIIIQCIIEVGLTHPAVIYFFVRRSGKRFEKQMIKNASNNHTLIYTTSILSDAHIVKDIIELHGIPCDMSTENHSNSNMGSALSLIKESSLWISDKSKIDEAKRLVEEYERSTSQDASAAVNTPWNCTSCGEECEGQFTSCWNCGGFKVAK